MNKKQVKLFIYLQFNKPNSKVSSQLFFFSHFLFSPFYQIAEDIQKFYSSSIAEDSDSNRTAIALIYHKTVSKACVAFTYIPFTDWHL